MEAKNNEAKKQIQINLFSKSAQRKREKAILAKINIRPIVGVPAFSIT